MNGETDERQAVVEETERWFLDRGLPHFIHHYRAREDILTRAAPVLGFVWLVSLVFAFGDRFEGWAQAGVIGATSVGLAAIWVLINVARKRRPFAYPTRVTVLELVIGLAIPPAVSLVGGHTIRTALILLGSELVLLGLVYAGASYGIVPIIAWVGGQVTRQLGDVTRVLTRALPMLLLFTTFLFVNTEVWQVAHFLRKGTLIGVLALFAVVTVVFVVVWLSEELDHIGKELDHDAMVDLCKNTPVRGHLTEGAAVIEPLSKRQRLNMVLVLVVSQLIQSVLVAAAVFGFFVVFGLLAIGQPVREAWLGEDDPAALFKVAGLLATFSALYFAVYAVTDSTYRDQFYSPIRRQLDKALAVRAAYLSLGPQ